MASATAGPRAERLVWLDVTRVLCALMILGIHWLRACYNAGLFGAGDRVNLVMDYQGHSGGLRLFHYVLIAGTAGHLSTWLTNLIGLLGGFGWEAVDALILISGFSLAISQGSKSLAPGQWLGWYGKRAKRILIPFYCVAFFFLALYLLAAYVLPEMHSRLAAAFDAKLLSQFHTPVLGVIISHIFLFDPYNRDWSADFFAPAWWFIPAILLAYAVYPFVRSASRVCNGIPLLIATALISAASFAAADAGLLTNETWYYILLQESFNFSLGVVVAGIWLGPRRGVLERALGDPRVLAIACAVFVLGNIANWSSHARPIASMLYGPSLVVVLVFLGTWLARSRHARLLTSVDAYDLYLVHQPFAFPIAIVAKTVLHSYAVFVGWFIFVAVAMAASKVLSIVQSWFFTARQVAVNRPLPGRKATREEAAS
jgi:peptidoglycan/LPS O-acetylase OafA/YrhL